ncbi:DUF779 domain-containing protein [Roseateles amylovorans]|uniref:DUF779 domain-containing protein n=1 Tax=Roseateles amylovorans TaxID=2978473 RepID=A0ABY6B184_9BURK|nr:DUF779 domain-containing protein [Roseateles amylovorans]UXH77749.1 DUF779 domain-containing protein [Roseateles amylovorans]
MTEPVLRVTATDQALALIDDLRREHGPLMFHQSGGCCDGSAPMCFPQGEFIIGDYDRLLGEIGGVPFYISGPQFEYWQHTQLIIDVVPGRGGMFSLEGRSGQRFLTRSRLFTDEESAWLAATAHAAPHAGSR